MSNDSNHTPPATIALEMNSQVARNALEHPALVAHTGQPLEKQDGMHSSGAFSTSPFIETNSDRLPEEEAEEENAEVTPAVATEINQIRLDALRKSPAAQLLGHSVLLLKAFQLDMDCPPRLRNYVHDQLSQWLQTHSGKVLNPDQLFIQFNTQDQPHIDNTGREHYSQRLSLTELGVISFNGATLTALMRTEMSEQLPDESTPTLTPAIAMGFIAQARWSLDYPALVEAFWVRHAKTWRALLKLSFLVSLDRHYTQKKISLEGFKLALETAGLTTAPQLAQSLDDTARGTQATAHMMALNDLKVPGAFQLRSITTSHCFIHLYENTGQPVEYISDDPVQMADRLTNTLNESGLLAPCLDFAQEPEEPPVTCSLEMIEGDLFSALTQAQKTLSTHCATLDADVTPAEFSDFNLLKPIERSLALACSIDLWQMQPDILARLPTPHKTAVRLMRKIIKAKLALDINPEHVFIRYLPGTSVTPLGSPRAPSTQVIVPDDKPISLAQALLSHYQVAQPVGYLDHDGRTVVYLDRTGKGDWNAAKELPVSPEDIAQAIREVDFLTLARNRIERFWDKQSTAVEHAFKSAFITQALISLKQKTLQRSSFDLIVQALEQLETLAPQATVQWSVIGFYVQHSALDGAQEQECPNLLVMSLPGRPERVLYQAGVSTAFVEFKDSDELNIYLQTAARDPQWRQAVLNHVALRHQSRLEYILKVWGAVHEAAAPVSVLRPWTDALYNPDTHKARMHDLFEKPLTQAPFSFMRASLKQNGVWDTEDQVVTSGEVILRFWTRQLNQLQILLAPMSVLLTPGLLATLAVEIGIAALNVASAHLPGARYPEKNQALLSILSLGLLGFAPHTPRLLGALKKLTAPARSVARLPASPPTLSRSFGWTLKQSMPTRRTRLEKFFNTESPLKTWDIPSHIGFATVQVRAWKLQRQFLLWTAPHQQARTLVVSTHGYYLPWSKNTIIPNGTELQVYAPHGHELVDPLLHRVVSRKVQPFATLNPHTNTPIAAPDSLQPYELTDKLLAGTVNQGMIKNYKIAKYQSTQGETYQDISHIVRDSNQSPFAGQLGSTPMDVLTVRNRFAMSDPTLEDLFQSLFEKGIHYDKILLVHCRCAAFKSLLGTAPVYTGP